MRRNADLEFLKRLADCQTPCVSLYLPTHRLHPEKQQDAIRFRNLLTQLEDVLPEKLRTGKLKAMHEWCRDVADETQFWNYRTEGLAIFGSPDTFEIFELQRPVEERLIVADSFHIKPLLRIQQSADRFQILGISRHEVHLYEGNRDALDEVELAAEVPRTLTDALGEELTEPHLTVARYGGEGHSAAHGGPAMFHGHGAKKDEVDQDNERFFRVVDRAIMEHHSQRAGVPLILAALPEHHHLFHDVSHNQFLISESIPVDPAAVTPDELRKEAWKILLPRYKDRMTKLASDFQNAFAAKRGAEDLKEIAQALAERRVGWLLVESERHVPGRLIRATGEVQFGNPDDVEMDDLLDDLAQQTLAAGGEVVVIPSSEMPTSTGAAAIYRY